MPSYDVGTTPVRILARNTGPGSIIYNASDATIFIGFDDPLVSAAAGLHSGIPILAGEKFLLGRATGDVPLGAVWAVTATGTKEMRVNPPQFGQ